MEKSFIFTKMEQIAEALINTVTVDEVVKVAFKDTYGESHTVSLYWGNSSVWAVRQLRSPFSLAIEKDGMYFIAMM